MKQLTKFQFSIITLQWVTKMISWAKDVFSIFCHSDLVFSVVFDISLQKQKLRKFWLLNILVYLVEAITEVLKVMKA